MQASLLTILEEMQDTDNPTNYFQWGNNVAKAVLATANASKPIDRADLEEIREAVAIRRAQSGDKNNRQFEESLGQQLWYAWKPDYKGFTAPETDQRLEARQEFTDVLLKLGANPDAKPAGFTVTTLEYMVQTGDRPSLLKLMISGGNRNESAMRRAYNHSKGLRIDVTDILSFFWPRGSALPERLRFQQ